MRVIALNLLALASMAMAAAIAEPISEPEAHLGAREAAEAAAATLCEWNGYPQTDFHGKPIKSDAEGCLEITNPTLINDLYSAIVTYGSYVCLYTSKTCSGSHQVIDVNGYRDMSNLPAYHSFNCNKC